MFIKKVQNNTKIRKILFVAGVAYPATLEYPPMLRNVLNLV